MIHLSKTDIEAVAEISGYTFDISDVCEEIHNTVVIYGQRNRDKRSVVAKLSRQPLRLEREYHIVQRLYRELPSRELLCRPIDKITLPNGLIALIFENDGKNILEEYQPSGKQYKSQCMSLNGFLNFAIQCCDCLEMIHKHQIIHGEIKLNAFLQSNEKAVKIWNFGSGARSLETSLTSEGWRKTINGNDTHSLLHMLIYMSPEQTGRTSFQPDHRTDLYSLGITFFVLLTQTLPFFHSSPMEIVHNVLSKKLPLTHETAPKTPEIVSAIIEKLTNKSPDERYTSAHGLRQDLKECLSQLEKKGQIQPFPLGRSDIASIFALPNNPCFGRKSELDLISSIIQRTAYMCRPKNKRQTLFSSNTTLLSTLKIDDTSSFKRVHNNEGKRISRPTEIVAIHGKTGVGKSTLIRNVKQYAQEYGYIAVSKFDKRQPTPYGCILRCLSIYLKHVLGESSEEIDRFSLILKKQLGAEIMSQLPTLLIDNVPELASFLSRPFLQRIPTEDLNSNCEHNMEVGEEIRTRFHTAFIEIFQAIVNFKFLTLFLEDLHEADEASIELLNSLVSAKLDFLVILSYRDNEMSKKTSGLLANQDAVISFVNIKNLDQSALMDLIRATMHRQEEIDLALLAPLVDFIHKKTYGNPFYVCQLIAALERKSLIYFTWEKRRWEYNLHEIEKELEIGNDGDVSIEFLVRRLKELPQDGRKFLKWASFIGNSFKYETVKNLMIENDDISDEDDTDDRCSPLYEEEEEDSLRCKEKNRFDAINGLQSALQQGFIQPTNNDEFRFTHDHYLEAISLLTSSEHQDSYRLRIISHFIHKDHVDSFWVADHVRELIHTIKGYSVKSIYRRMLIQAGDKAFDSGAHQLAYTYYSAAYELLSSGDSWVNGEDSKYLETLHLYTRLAEISLFTDETPNQNYLKTILLRAESPIDRAAAYRIQHRCRWSRAEGSMESVLILVNCLRDLGIEEIKMDLKNEELKELYENTKHEVLSMGFENILKLPICESRLIRTGCSIMEELCLWAYWTNNARVMLTVGSRFVLKTLKSGTTPTTGVGLVIFGIAATQLFKAYEFAEKIGHVGISLCNNYSGYSESGRARFFYATYLSNWKDPYRHSIIMARIATKQALKGGDRTYSIFAHIQTIFVNLFCGGNMSDVLKDAKDCAEGITETSKPLGAVITITSLIRFILSVQGKTYLTEEGLFEDKEFKEKHFLRQCAVDNSSYQFHVYYYHAFKVIALSIYCFDEAAVNQSSEQIAMANALPPGRLTHLMFFSRCVSLARLIRNKKRDDLIPELMGCREKLADWAYHSHPENLGAHLDCIDAEIASLNSNELKAQELFDQAIRKAKQGKWHIEISLMYELAGEYYLRRNLSTIAGPFIEKAIAGFRHSGMFGRANQVEERHLHLIKESQHLDIPKSSVAQTESLQRVPNKRDSLDDLSLKQLDTICNTNVNSINTSPEEALLALDIVDLASILKSCQVISSEMNFELLLKQMLEIVLENSGADSGVIIVKENTSFSIVGRGSQQDECDIFSKPRPLSEEEESMMTRISQYTIHAQKSLFIIDVQKDSRFSDGSGQTKSCICTPIIHKSAVVGCIYIEAPIGSLTSRHEIVLRLLSQQIGISVTNALLFKSIQKVTYANVKMIENQKAALEEARKSKEAALHAMKLKADFLANMSHELRTPFSGFYGMISLLSETSLDSEQQDIVLTAKESCETLLKIIDDLLNFSKLEAGKVTLDVGPLVIEEVIADTIEILSPLATRKGLELAYIVDPNVPVTVLADSSRIRQVLTNLLGNAIKFTHGGGVEIKCHMKQLSEPQESGHIQLRFEIIDTGIGICPEEQQRLFEPFSQLDGGTTRKYGGTGLGLSICLQLVRLMAGDIGVESQPEKGSNFWFTVGVDKEDDKSSRRRSGKPLTLKAIREKQRILLATSSHLNTKMMESLLSDFTFASTLDMQQAVSKALQERYHILILDVPPNPTGFITHQIQSVVDDPECELHIVLLYTPSTEGHRVAAEAINSGSNRRGRLVKMAKPARRVKLLRLLEIVTTEKTAGNAPPSLTPIIPTRMKDYFNQKELEMYTEKSVLIAEDNLVARKLLKQQLEKLGFSVQAADDGEEAIQIYRQRPPNYFSLAFFDHHMPKCDGVEATRRIRALEKKTGSRLPIVALTADIQASARQVCIDAGMDDYLTKPLVPKNLAATLRQLYPSIQHTHYDTPNSSTPSSPASSL
ncbi:hypothetical protein BY458DRAFT_585506 [Sporodiniella umbellata]|nr:hypothetical protein BY458DRAFT_585506 [Sporodiniella umbellata]